MRGANSRTFKRAWLCFRGCGGGGRSFIGTQANFLVGSGAFSQKKKISGKSPRAKFWRGEGKVWLNG